MADTQPIGKLLIDLQAGIDAAKANPCNRCGQPESRHTGVGKFCPFYSTFRASRSSSGERFGEDETRWEVACVHSPLFFGMTAPETAPDGKVDDGLLAYYAKDVTGFAGDLARLVLGQRGQINELWRWCYSLALAGAKAQLALRNAEQREAGEENFWPAQQEWHEMVGSSHSIFLRSIREAAGVDNDAFLAFVRGERGAEFSAIAEALYEAAASQPPLQQSEEPKT